MTRDEWLKAHAFLRPVADAVAQVEEIAAELEAGRAEIPVWEEYAEDFGAGVPLLQSAGAAVDLEPAGRTAVALVGKLAEVASKEELRGDARALDARLRRAEDAPRRVVDWLLGGDEPAPSSPGLLRFLGWTATARHLAPVVAAFSGWRAEERWQRSYCPTCGSAPAMAQLIGVDPARIRFLRCGYCRTSWQYRRTQCPFCDDDRQRIGVVAVEGEGGLRIDFCEACQGYLKTYAGQGSEDVLLADWTSLHLDLLAQDRGLKRSAASLYDLDVGSAR
jgi:FdhE protein